ncbi:MAG: hypothetical protein ACRDF9_12180 [Candidatus Limnocylindria bacterium]
MKLILEAMLATAMTVAVAACAPRVAAPSQTPTSTTSAPTVAAATTTPVTTGAPPTSTAQSTSTGAITGLLGYPAEGHPPVTIYAISTTDRSVFFSVDVPRAATPPKSPYTITVQPGTYNLFAYLEGNDGPAGGAYTEFVRCGLHARCSDHTPIDVTVGAGETVRDIEVSDWYAPPGTFPPRPR